MMFELDEKGRPGRPLEVNKAACTTFGYNREEFLQKLIFSLISPEDLKKMPQMIEYIRRDIPHLLEINVVAKDGALIPFELNFYRFFIKGKMVGLIIGRDIRERKRIEDEIKESYEQITNILEFFVHPTFVINTDKQVIAWNQGMELLTSVYKKDILGKGEYEYSYALYHEKKPDLVDYILDRDPLILNQYPNVKFKNNTVNSEIILNNAKTGERMWYSVKASPLYNCKGAVIGGIELFQDISESKYFDQSTVRRINIHELLNHFMLTSIRENHNTVQYSTILRMLGEAAEISRINLYKILRTNHAQTIVHPLFEWITEGAVSLRHDKKFAAYIQRHDDDSFFQLILHNEDIMHSSISDLPMNDQQILSEHHVSSLLLIPLRTDNENIGYLQLDICTECRKWSTGELNAYKMVGEYFSSLLSRTPQ